MNVAVSITFHAISDLFCSSTQKKNAKNLTFRLTENIPVCADDRQEDFILSYKKYNSLKLKISMEHSAFDGKYSRNAKIELYSEVAKGDKYILSGILVAT